MALMAWFGDAFGGLLWWLVRFSAGLSPGRNSSDIICPRSGGMARDGWLGWDRCGKPNLSDLATSVGSGRSQGGCCTRRHLHSVVPRHWLDLGAPDMGHMVGMGRRMTSMLVMLFLYFGYWPLRVRFGKNRIMTAFWQFLALSAWSICLSFTDPVIWWKSLHQPPSLGVKGSAIASEIRWPSRSNHDGVHFVVRRYRADADADNARSYSIRGAVPAHGTRLKGYR